MQRVLLQLANVTISLKKGKLLLPMFVLFFSINTIYAHTLPVTSNVTKLNGSVNFVLKNNSSVSKYDDCKFNYFHFNNSISALATSEKSYSSKSSIFTI